MTEQEAIKVIRNKACNDRCTEIHCDDSCMYGENKCAFHMAIEALEKQIAKKPVDKIMYLECPACGDVGILDCGYCPVCGQKLDWEGEWKWKD